MKKNLIITINIKGIIGINTTSTLIINPFCPIFLNFLHIRV